MVTLAELAGSRWSGKGELWLDPLGNTAHESDCTIAIDDGAVHYTWSHEGTDHIGHVTLGESGAEFQDSFHAAEPMQFEYVADAPSIFKLTGTYMEVWG